MKYFLLLLLALPVQAALTIEKDGSVRLTKEQINVLGERIKADNIMIDELQKEVWKMKVLLKAPKECV